MTELNTPRTSHQDPSETAIEILGIVINPSLRLTAFVISYTFLFLFVFILLYSFSHMLTEQTAKFQDSLDANAQK